MLHHLPNNTISLLEAINAGTNLVHLAGNVAAKDGRPLLNKDTQATRLGSLEPTCLGALFLSVLMFRRRSGRSRSSVELRTRDVDEGM